jgi:hypothetical protein
MPKVPQQPLRKGWEWFDGMHSHLKGMFEMFMPMLMAIAKERMGQQQQKENGKGKAQ